MTALTFLLLLCTTGVQARHPSVQARTAAAPGQLDAALGAGDLDRALQLVIGDVNGADQQFLVYLQQDLDGARPDAGTPSALERARRLAAVFFTLYESDFNQAVVRGWEAASQMQKRQLLPILRDHVEVWRQERAVDDHAVAPIGFRYPLLKQYLDLARRYEAIGFGKGELQALQNATNLDEYYAWKTWQLAKNLKDEVDGAWAAYQYSVWTGDAQAEAAANQALEAAGRLRLPSLQQLTLTRLAWRALNRDDFEAHVGYFRKGLGVVRTIPVAKTMVGRVSRRPYPAEAWFCLAIADAVADRDKTEARKLIEQGRALSRTHGGKEGELAFLVAAMTSSYRSGLVADEAAAAEALARSMADPLRLARVLLVKASGLSGGREYAAAVAALNEAGEIFRKAGERAHVANCLSERAAVRVQMNDFPAATTDYDEAIRTYRELGLREDSITTAMDAGWAFRSQPLEAARYLGPAVESAKQLGDPLLVAKTLLARAQVVLPNSTSDGLRDWMESLSFAERVSEETGYPQSGLGWMQSVSDQLSRAGLVNEALDVQTRRAELARAQGFPDIEAAAYRAILNIRVYFMGDLTQGPELVRTWQALFQQPGWTVSINDASNLALAYRLIGEPALALAQYAQALKIAATAPGSERFERATHFNINQVLLALGDYDGAMRESEEEFKLYDATYRSWGTPIELQRAQWYNRAGFVHMLAGDTARALEASLEAIRQEGLVQPGTALATYLPYFNPADMLAQAGRFEEAITFHTNRVERARKIKSVVGERTALEQLAAAYLRAGKIDAAREALAAAAAISRKPPGPETGTLATTLLLQARVEMAARDLPKAESLLVESRKMANPYDLDQLWQIDRATAQVLAGTRQHGRAREAYESALASLERMSQRLRPEEFSAAFSVDRPRVYDECAAYLASRAADTGLDSDASAGLRIVERRRAQLMWDRLATGWSRQKPEALPAPLQRAQDAELRLVAKQLILRDQFRLAPARRSAALIKKLEADLQASRDKHARLLSALAQGQYRWASPAALPGDLVDQIRQKLGRDRALVEYLVTDEATFAFVITSAGTRLRRLPIGRDALRTQVRALLQPFYRLGAGDVDLVRLGFDLDAAHALYTRLLAPIEPLLGGATRIVVVPDDVLCYLPVELLVDRLPPQAPPGNVLFAQYERAGFLLRRYTVSYLTAAASLLQPSQEVQAAGSATNLLAMANPTAAQSAPAVEQEDPLRRQLRASNLSGAFGPLAAAVTEVEGIRRSFPAGSVTVLAGEQATETSYKSLAGKAGIIHMATHAVAADDQPFYSTLMLAPDPDAREDGFLQAWELVRYPLQARLVVLSACETARGPVGQGDGMIGLVSAFQQAGARSVVATQWSIDESTVELMVPFYKEVAAGRTLAIALRDAKLEMLKKRARLGGAKMSLAHPFFWAPFVLVGAGE